MQPAARLHSDDFLQEPVVGRLNRQWLELIESAGGAECSTVQAPSSTRRSSVSAATGDCLAPSAGADLT